MAEGARNMSSGLSAMGFFLAIFSAAGIAHTIESGTPNLAALIGAIAGICFIYIDSDRSRR